MSATPVQAFSMLVLGIAVGAIIAMGFGLSRAPRALQRWVGILFAVSVAAYALKIWADMTGMLTPLQCMPLGILAMGAVGWFWLFTITLFDDLCRLRPSSLAPIMGSVAIGVFGVYFAGEKRLWVMAAFHIAQLALAADTLVVILRGWRGDLIEARRRMRAGFLLTATVYILAMMSAELWSVFNRLPDWYEPVNITALAAVCLGGAIFFLQPRPDVFGASDAAPRVFEAGPAKLAPPPVGEAAPPLAAARGVQEQAEANGSHLQTANGAAAMSERAVKADLDRLDRLMIGDQIWREEGLTIAGLASRSGIPETQLRRLINDRLGYRNFPSFVNAHRIAEAQRRLADPREARTSISTMAFDLGFASLGPFNRAFREATGASPSEWRRAALSDGSPIPETA